MTCCFVWTEHRKQKIYAKNKKGKLLSTKARGWNLTIYIICWPQGCPGRKQLESDITPFSHESRWYAACFTGVTGYLRHAK